MPLKENLRKVLVIGSGPIIIGQGAEFDYAGTQACRCLKEAGLEVVLVNSNPATIMTDASMADHIYIEPLTVETVRRIIELERPDGVLSTLGGQTGLTLSMELAKEGFLDRMGVELLGASCETIDKSEDRLIFKETMIEIGQPVIPSVVASSVDEALVFAQETGYPVVVRPAFTLGGTGGGMPKNEEELLFIARSGIAASPINQILVEQSVAGWKEIEFEVMRDSQGSVMTVCSMENMDPVGVHTGDSIVAAPCVSLNDAEYQMLRAASLDIVSALGVEGGCNCQFALKPHSMEYAVIEVNPRVSRSSALASKATGYPIARVATQIAIGYTLDEIMNRGDCPSWRDFELTLDYIVVKFPRWPFDKFTYASRELGTQMKATGEVMSMGQNFEQAIMKAVRGAQISMDSLSSPALRGLSGDEVMEHVKCSDDRRLFAVYEALRRGVVCEQICAATGIDMWFVKRIKNLADMEELIAAGPITPQLYGQAKLLGYLDIEIARIAKHNNFEKTRPSYIAVDTCAKLFGTRTPYFYAAYEKTDEVDQYREETGRTVLVLGSGPIRIGQGIEFDYASVHCVKTLRRLGYDVVIINNNPETVSTDYDTANRLYFEPLTGEDVMDVVAREKPCGAVVAFGGQTAIKLAAYLQERGVPILGTPQESINRAEDRECFDALLEELDIKRPSGHTVMDAHSAAECAARLGYPVLLRPSYVLGGQNMVIANSEEELLHYMDIILQCHIENPVLVDKYLKGTELEVDAICDGSEILIPGIMEHIERAGVHSGDSIAVYPAWGISDDLTSQIVHSTARIATALGTMGLINIQYLVYKDELYVIEVNPRSSRTIPYLSKVTGVPMVDLATRAMVGEKLSSMGYGTGLYRASGKVAVKVPVFSFAKLTGVDTLLGPEMKSTGEVLGIADTMDEALYKGLVAAGYSINRKSRGALITVKDADKAEAVSIAGAFEALGFKIYATAGTAHALFEAGITVTEVKKLHEEGQNCITVMEKGLVDYVISTSSRGLVPTKDGVRIRRRALELGLPCLTSMDTSRALVRIVAGNYTTSTTTLVDSTKL